MSDDPLEQEADRVAEQVLASPFSATVSAAPPQIQRLTGQSTGRADTAPASVERVLASSGNPLEPTLRQDMEQRFGHDFSQVRIHCGAAEEESAREVNASAYTVGHQIVFGLGQFAPESHKGRRLIAHELTHVVQQSDSNMAFRAQQIIARTSKLHNEEEIVETMEAFHSKNKHLGEEVLEKIETGIRIITTRAGTLEVAYAFFDHYSGFSGKRIMLMTPEDEAAAKKSTTYAKTDARSDTFVRSDVLVGWAKLKLAALLLHEVSHIDQFPNWIGTLTYQEGQSYGVEYFYARIGNDTNRRAEIIDIISTGKPIGTPGVWGSDARERLKKDFKITLALMTCFREVFYNGSSPNLPQKEFPDLDNTRASLLQAQVVTSFQNPNDELAHYITYVGAHLDSMDLPDIPPPP